MSTDPKSEYLEDQLEKQAAINLLVEGASMVANGGVEGIIFAAQEQPELLLAAINALVALIQLQQEEIRELVESRLELLDTIERITDLATK